MRASDLLQRLRALWDAPEDPDGWWDLATLAHRAGDAPLKRYAFEAGATWAAEGFAELAPRAAALGLPVSDPRRVLPLRRHHAWEPQRKLQGQEEVPRPRVSPDGQRVLFVGMRQAALFEARTWACAARFSPCPDHPTFAWISPTRLGLLRWSTPLGPRLEVHDVEAWPRGWLAESPQCLQDSPPVAWYPTSPYVRAQLEDGRVLIGGAQTLGGFALVWPDGRSLRFEDHQPDRDFGGLWNAVAGPGGAVLVASLEPDREGSGRGTTTLQVFEGEGARFEGPDDPGDGVRRPTRLVASTGDLREPVCWDEEGMVGLRLVDGRVDRRELFGCRAPGAPDAWVIGLDADGGERVTGRTPDGAVVLSAPGRYRLVDAVTGRARGRGRLPAGTRAHPFDAEALLAVRPGRFEVVARRRGRPSPARADDPGAIRGLAVTRGRLLITHRGGRVRLVDLATGALRAEARLPEARTRPQDAPSLPPLVRPSLDGGRALVAGLRRLLVLDLRSLEELAEVPAGFSPSTPERRVVTAALSPAGDQLAWADGNGRVRRRSVDRGEDLEALTLGRPGEGLEALAYHPHDGHLAVLSRVGRRVFEVGRDGQVVREWALGPGGTPHRGLRLVALPWGWLVATSRGRVRALIRGEDEPRALWSTTPGGTPGIPVALDLDADWMVLARDLGDHAQARLVLVRASDGVEVEVRWPWRLTSQASAYALDPAGPCLLVAEGETLRRFDLPSPGESTASRLARRFGPPPDP